ncbi:MAG TPA: hypothetical protein PKY59_26470 [Pyrinomonadaceae bacterium]|nr:hypothetical protein [Pyrinomonadaceae bacterium]
MKIIYLICAIVVLQITCAAQTNSVKVNGVEVGTWYPAAVRKLGKPVSVRHNETFPCEDGKVLTARYNGLVLRFIESYPAKKLFVGSIEITSAKWSVSGIKIGANFKDVKAEFSGKLRYEGNFKVYGGFIKDGFSHFYFKNGKLVKIIAEINLC